MAEIKNLEHVLVRYPDVIRARNKHCICIRIVFFVSKFGALFIVIEVVFVWVLADLYSRRVVKKNWEIRILLDFYHVQDNVAMK
jgi:hypothetical protein